MIYKDGERMRDFFLFLGGVFNKKKKFSTRACWIGDD